MPDRGAATVASLRAFCARRSWASADFTLPCATDRLDSVPSNAFCEMNFSFRSRTFIARVFSASASCAFALSYAPRRSATRASRSAVSKRATACPSRTGSPSRTSTLRTSPETRALTTAWRTGWRAPDTASQRDSGRISTAVRSAAANSSVGGALARSPSDSPPSWRTRSATAPPSAPATARIASVARTRRRVKRMAMKSPWVRTRRRSMARPTRIRRRPSGLVAPCAPRRTFDAANPVAGFATSPKLRGAAGPGASRP